MANNWMSDSEKLVVFFGGYDCLGPLVSELEPHPLRSVAASGQNNATCDQKDDSSQPKVRYLQDMYEPAAALRSKIIETLGGRSDITHVEDLFDEKGAGGYFDPIVFTLSIPKSLQVGLGIAHEDAVPVPEFTLVYDGRLIMVAAVAPIGKRPWGVYNARERFETIMKGICKFERNAPCLTHEAVTFLEETAKPSERYRDLFLPVMADHSMRGHIQHLYGSLSRELWRFYGASRSRTEGLLIASKVRDLEKELIETTKTLMKTKWHHVRTRRRVVEELRSKCVDIFAEVSEYLSKVQELREETSGIEEMMAHNTLFRKLMDTVHLDEYTKTEVIHVESVMRVVQHVEGEIGTYSTSSSAVSSL